MEDVRNGSAIMFPKLVWVAQKWPKVPLLGEHLAPSSEDSTSLTKAKSSTEEKDLYLREDNLTLPERPVSIDGPKKAL
jgi:hypothetical protein